MRPGYYIEKRRIARDIERGTNDSDNDLRDRWQNRKFLFDCATDKYSYLMNTLSVWPYVHRRVVDSQQDVNKMSDEHRNVVIRLGLLFISCVE